MKKIKLSQEAVERTVEALDEIEAAVLGETIARTRTDVRAGADDLTCKPWLCPMPMYGIPLPAEL